jgi:Tfp pilus assembly protein PilO
VQKDQAVLTEKLDLLRSVAQTVSVGSAAALTALPSSNPSLAVTTQVKVLASTSGLALSNIKSSGEAEDTSGLPRVDVTFEVEGARPQVIAFLKSVENIAPIALIDKVKISESTAATRANVTLRSFWAALPKALPPITQPIVDLTSAERKTLTDVSALTQPLFVELPAAGSSGKSDPFSP